jgi:hypothetical protein
MKNSNSILSNLIEEVFVDKQEDVLNELQKHKLDKDISQVLIAIDKVDNQKLFANKSFVSSLSSSYLTNVNSKIAKVEDIERKENLEYIVKELSNQILIRLISKTNSSPKQVLDQISEGLTASCVLNNWDYNKLYKIMNFDLLHSVAAKTDKNIFSEDDTKGIYYYVWNGNEEILKEIIYDLKDKKIIKSTTEFKKLFSEHNGKLNIRVKASCLDYIIILFDELYSKRLITPKGYKAKHFTPIKTYLVDFDKKLLIKSEAKQIKYGIVKNKQKYASIKESVTKFINGFFEKS